MKVLSLEVIVTKKTCDYQYNITLDSCLSFVSYNPSNRIRSSNQKYNITLEMIERHILITERLFEDKTSNVFGYPLSIVRFDQADKPSITEDKNRIFFPDDEYNRKILHTLFATHYT